MSKTSSADTAAMDTPGPSAQRLAEEARTTSRASRPDRTVQAAKAGYETARDLLKIELEATNSLVTRATWLGTLMSGVMTLVLTFGGATWFSDLPKYSSSERFALISSGTVVAIILACAALGALWAARPSSGSQGPYAEYRKSVNAALFGHFSEAARYRKLTYACAKRFTDQSTRNNIKAMRLRWAYLMMSLAIPALIVHALVVQRVLSSAS